MEKTRSDIQKEKVEQGWYAGLSSWGPTFVKQDYIWITSDSMMTLEGPVWTGQGGCGTCGNGNGSAEQMKMPKKTLKSSNDDDSVYCTSGTD